MSTNSECEFFEDKPGEWYYFLETGFSMPGWWKSDAISHGPFTSRHEARSHLGATHANPGGSHSTPYVPGRTTSPMEFEMNAALVSAATLDDWDRGAYLTEIREDGDAALEAARDALGGAWETSYVEGSEYPRVEAVPLEAGEGNFAFEIDFHRNSGYGSGGFGSGFGRQGWHSPSFGLDDGGALAAAVGVLAEGANVPLDEALLLACPRSGGPYFNSWAPRAFTRRIDSISGLRGEIAAYVAAMPAILGSAKKALEKVWEPPGVL